MITITLPTNINGKLACQSMIHLAPAPPPIPEPSLPTLRITTTDHSHPPTTWQVTDIVRLHLHQVTTLVAQASHGITATQLINQFIAAGTPITAPVAIYICTKITQP